MRFSTIVLIVAVVILVVCGVKLWSMYPSVPITSIGPGKVTTSTPMCEPIMTFHPSSTPDFIFRSAREILQADKKYQAVQSACSILVFEPGAVDELCRQDIINNCGSGGAVLRDLVITSAGQLQF